MIFTKQKSILTLLLFPLSLSAQTFGSYVGSSATFANSVLKTSAGPVSKLYNGSSGASIPGATYVTAQQGNVAAGVTSYSTTYTGNLAGATGSITFSCDDFCTVKLNGVLLGATTAAQWNQVVTFPIPANAYVNGLNTFTFDVTNTVGNSGVMFTANAVVPVTSYTVTCIASMPSPPPTTSVPAICTAVKQ